MSVMQVLFSTSGLKQNWRCATVDGLKKTATVEPYLFCGLWRKEAKKLGLVMTKEATKLYDLRRLQLQTHILQTTINAIEADGCWSAYVCSRVH